jgi:hypothetical protein
MNLQLLRECVKALVNEATMFEEWLSPDVVNLLISDYADTSDAMGVLKWEYSTKLKSNVWGIYSPSVRTLYVNQAKTKGLFKQQVNTILHEIEHWNQHIKIANKYPHDPIRAFGNVYKQEKATYGYWNSPMEVGARRMADMYVDAAMERIGKHYGGRLEGGDIDSVVEELMNDFLDNDEKPLTRVQIGGALKNFDLNSPENMKAAVEKLRTLGVKVMGA